MVFVAMEIMSAKLFRIVGIFTVVSSTLVGFGTSLLAAEITLQRVPPLTVEQAPAYPENVARYHAGAAVEAAPQSNPIADLQLSSKAEDANTAEAALLCDDPTVGYALSNGHSSLVISLSRIENVDTVSFLNRGAKGEMIVSVSNTKLPVASAQWRKVSEQELTSDAMKVKIGPSEAKYVKLTFKVSDAGRISALGVYSTPTVAAFTMPRTRKSGPQDHSDSFALISYNLTDVHAKARALYVSSGDAIKQANNMIDDQPATTYAFSANDSTPTTVIDLGRVTTLRRISTVYSPRQGNVDFFVVQSLPGGRGNAAGNTQSVPRTLRLNDTAFADMQMVGSVADGSGRAAVDFPETSGRYIVLRWTPVTQQDKPFTVAEVAAFGGNNQGSLLAANTVGSSDGQMEYDGKSVMDGKDAKDLGDSKDIPAEEAPAEGPGLGLPPPPPFTFVPQIVPTSP